jgi:pyruvate ferredoxin oxidoreductase gamma subunit
MLGGFAALTGAISIESVAKAIGQRFSGALGDRNVAAAREAFSAAAA